MNNLAALYKFTGRYSEAESLFKQALAICESTLGVGHPDTIRIQQNYTIFSREAYR
ncbi:tetratricopeptide repeat protein [Nostoc sp. UHCC 0252]|uniref:tetratricopeptide repeat protein n=1 Tax=Nostoc sp. UHCC 0252 TaxID=3110241 RepID=UPI002B1F83EF|nr:tetratricopeptide repeat protein [Nostoc sp. UHCC 0252]MEA5604336.1 tetratricopeptide repeat protein [Nostoc sp. UHCC 0252]